jgi:hypothetical protein
VERARKLFIRCDLCSPRKPGWLWLRGTTWVACPQCDKTGRVEIVEELVKPRGKVFIPGDTRGATLHHPMHARRFG